MFWQIACESSLKCQSKQEKHEEEEEEEEEEDGEEVVEGMNVHLSEDKEVISVRSQQLSIVAIMRLSTMDTRQRTVHCNATIAEYNVPWCAFNHCKT